METARVFEKVMGKFGSLVENLCQYIRNRQQDLDIRQLDKYVANIKREYNRLSRASQEIVEQYGMMRKINMELLEVVSALQQKNDGLQEENAALKTRIQGLFAELNGQQLRFDRLMVEKSALLKEIVDLQQELTLAGE